MWKGTKSSNPSSVKGYSLVSRYIQLFSGVSGNKTAVRKRARLPGVTLTPFGDAVPEGQTAPDFERKAVSLSVQEGKPAVFRAKIKGRPKPQVTWKRTKGDISERDRFMSKYDEATGECTLQIPQVCEQDRDTYTCCAVNKYGKAVCAAALNVIVVVFNKQKEDIMQDDAAPDPADFRKLLRKRENVGEPPQQQQVKTEDGGGGGGGEVKTEDGGGGGEVVDERLWDVLIGSESRHYDKICAEFGVKDLRWTLSRLEEKKQERHLQDGVVMNEDGQRHSVKSVRKKTVSGVRDLSPEDAGLYHVDVEGGGDRLSAEFKVSNVGFVVKMEEVKAQEREDAVFECVLTRPMPRIRWMGKNALLQSGDKHSFTASEDKLTHRLVIRDVQQADRGVYAAIAGAKSCSAWLLVGDDTDLANAGKKKERKTTSAGGAGAETDLEKITREQQEKEMNEAIVKMMNESSMKEMNESSMKEMDESSTKKMNEAIIKIMKESSMKEMNESSIKEMNEAIMKMMKESSMKEISESSMKEMNEAIMKMMKESSMKEMKESSTKKMNEAIMKIMKESSMKEMSESSMKQINEAIMKMMEESSMMEMNESSMTEMNEAIMKMMEDSSMTEISESSMKEMNEAIMKMMKESSMKEMNEAIMKMMMKESSMKEMNESSTKKMNEAIMKLMKESSMKEMNESSIKEMNEVIMKIMKESSMKEISESSMKEMNEAIMKIMKESSMTEMKESSMKEMNKAIMKMMKESSMKEMNESSIKEMNQAIMKMMEDSSMTEISESSMKQINEAIIKMMEESPMKEMSESSMKEMNEAIMKMMKESSMMEMNESSTKKMNEAIMKLMKESSMKPTGTETAEGVMMDEEFFSIADGRMTGGNKTTGVRSGVARTSGDPSVTGARRRDTTSSGQASTGGDMSVKVERRTEEGEEVEVGGRRGDGGSNVLDYNGRVPKDDDEVDLMADDDKSKQRAQTRHTASDRGAGDNEAGDGGESEEDYNKEGYSMELTDQHTQAAVNGKTMDGVVMRSRRMRPSALIQDTEIGAGVHFVRGLSDVTAIVGQRAELSCRLSADHCDGGWYHGNRKIGPADGVLIRQEGSSHHLVISSCQEEHGGTYRFEADGRKTEATVHVKDPPRIDPDALAVFCEPLRVRAGQNAVFKLPFLIGRSAGGAEPVKIGWFLEGEELRDGDAGVTVERFESHSRLLMSKLTRRHTGQLSLRLRNHHGTTEATTQLTVLDKPTSPLGPAEVLESSGSCVHFKWRPPKDDGGSEVTNYTLERRQVGRNTWKKLGEVPGVPHYRDTDVELGRRYCYRIRAETSEGLSDLLETEDLQAGTLAFPGAPAPPTVVSSFKDVINLCWAPPGDSGGSRILGYMVEKRKKNSNLWTVINPANELIKEKKCSVTDIVEGIEYEFRVVAINLSGPGEYSNPSEFVYARDPQKPPGKVTAVKVTDTSYSHFSLSWSKPEARPGVQDEAAGYFVEVRRGAEGAEWSRCNATPVLLTSYSLQGLRPMDVHWARVIATNHGGDGPPQELDRYVLAMPRPVRPRFTDTKMKTFMVVRAGNSVRININFEASPRPDVVWLKDNAPVPRRVTVSNSEGSTQILVPTSERSDSGVYSVLVKNMAGQETLSMEVRVTDEPKPPGRMELEQNVAGTVTLRWEPSPDEKRDDRLHYAVSTLDSHTRTWTTVAERLFNHRLTVCHLVAGREYRFRVYARNDMGTSSLSESPPWGLEKTRERFVVSVPTPKHCDLRCAPAFLVPLKLHSAPQGYECYMSCAVKGDPKPRITWFRDGVSLNTDTNYLISNTCGVCSLLILKVTTRDTGEYSVSAENSQGRALSSTVLTVRE